MLQRKVKGFHMREQQSIREIVSFYLLLTSVVCKDLTERAEPPDSPRKGKTDYPVGKLN